MIQYHLTTEVNFSFFSSAIEKGDKKVYFSVNVMNTYNTTFSFRMMHMFPEVTSATTGCVLSGLESQKKKLSKYLWSGAIHSHTSLLRCYLYHSPVRFASNLI